MYIGTTLDNKVEVKTGFTTSFANDTLEVSTADLKTCKDASGQTIAITADSLVFVEYNTSLSENCDMGQNSNENTVDLTYSSNPNTESDGNPGGDTTTTKEDRVEVFSYKLDFKKVDKDSERPLQGAKFTIQATGADDNESKDKYLQADGSLGTTAYEFTTDADGKIVVNRIDKGTYTMKETSAPEPYEKLYGESFTFQITPTIAAPTAAGATATAATLTQLVNTVTAQNEPRFSAPEAIAANKLDGNLTDHKILAANDSVGADVTSGTVYVHAADSKKVIMPLTGLSGIQTIIAAGAVLFIGCLSGLIYRWRKRKNNR